MDPNSFNEDDLKKSNIAQLKAICKERQITGYSKLAKPLIIQKILDHTARNMSLPVAPTKNAQPGADGNQQASGSTLASQLQLRMPSVLPDTSRTTSTFVSTVTNPTKAHITTSATAGLKRPFLPDPLVSNVPPPKKTKTDPHISSDDREVNATVPATMSLSGIRDPSLPASTKRPVTPSSLDSSVMFKKTKIVPSTMSVDVEDFSLTAAQAQRKNLLEEDPMATNVQHNSVTCDVCGKIVKYTMFDLYHWNRHKTRCKSDLSLNSRSSSVISNNADSSLTAAQAERKRILDQDPLATNVQHNSVTCDACGKVVKYTMFDLYHWNRHKTRCKPGLPGPSQSSSVSSNDADSSLTAAQAQRKGILEEDPLATNVQHNSVTCNACGKVVKYTMFDLHHWTKHKTRCKSNISLSRSSSVTMNSTSSQSQVKTAAPSSQTPTSDTNSTLMLTAAQAERKQVLEEDTLATNIQHCSVTCRACGKVVKYTMFDLFLWEKHKSRCKLDASVLQSSSSLISSISQANDTQPRIKDIDILYTAKPSRVSPFEAGETSTDHSLTEAQSKRKRVLELDPLASNVKHCSLTCKACGKLVKYTMFDLFHWNRHKARCKPLPSNMSSTQGEATSVTKGKRFTPLVASTKIANLASTKASVFSEEEDLVHSHAGPPLTTSLAIPIASVFSSHEIAVPIASGSSSHETAMLCTTRSSVAIHADAKSTPRTRTYAAFAPPSAIPSARLRALKVATSGPIVRKASSVPDITLEVNSPTSLSLYHLDFPMSIPIVLNRISMPPALAQRKQVARFAVILSQIAIQDLSNCMLVSRMFRYAIYLSASTRLARNFSGYRLNRIIHRLPANMMNMWPYLLQRQGEEKFRRRVFEESFLGRVFSGTSVIAPRLWASPDNDKQIVIAIRFLITRLFFTVSVGGGQSVNDWLNGMIVDAREIIKGEVWCIDVIQTSKALETFYVVESTCEVVGFAPSPSKAEGPLPIKMRADWSSYIDQRSSIIPPLQLITNGPGRQLDPTRSLSSIPATSLMDQLSCVNHEEFTKGISKLWLKKVQIQQEVGVAKRVVAERYILASVVENSVSGRYKTSTEMAHDFAGVPTELCDGKKPKVKLNLFLPAHHHVESVHFTTAQGRPLHPALAVVQTPAREYYVLRDNGMQVGCEEDGVARVWMTILGCAINGERV